MGENHTVLSSISVEITERCNRNCIYCSRHAIKDKGSDISFALTKRLIDEAIDTGIRRGIGLTGGEPLLHPHVFEIIEYAVDWGLDVVVTTSGDNMTDSFINGISRLGDKIMIVVSLDADSKRENDRIRGDGSFSSAIAAMERCTKANVPVCAVTTLIKQNIQKVPKITKLLKNMNVAFYSARRLIPCSSCRELEVDSGTYMDFLKSSFKKKTKLFMDEPLLVLIDREKYLKEALLSESSPGCPAGISYCAVLHDGTVTPCAFLPFAVGNIQKEHFRDIWNDSPVLRKLRNRELRGKCGRCEFKGTCGGCRAEAFMKTGDIFGESQTCWYAPSDCTW